MKKSLIVFLFLLFYCSAFAGIATKEKQDILKLIGTTYAPNGKFAWIELNGEDYGWTREGRNVGKYRIVMVEMGSVATNTYLTATGLVEGTYKVYAVDAAGNLPSASSNSVTVATTATSATTALPLIGNSSPGRLTAITSLMALMNSFHQIMLKTLSWKMKMITAVPPSCPLET